MKWKQIKTDWAGRVIKGMAFCTLLTLLLCVGCSMLVRWGIVKQNQLQTTSYVCYAGGMLLGMILLLKKEKEHRLLLAGDTAAGELVLLLLLKLAAVRGEPAGILPILLSSAGAAVAACILSGNAKKPAHRPVRRT